MKLFLFILVGILTFNLSTFSKSPEAKNTPNENKISEASRIGLELLIKNASNIEIEGDVQDYETLVNILASARFNKSTFFNNCEFQKSPQRYNCTLFLINKIPGSLIRETTVNYQIFSDDEGNVLGYLPMKAYVSREL